MYDFLTLNQEQHENYQKFLFKISSSSSPLKKSKNENDLIYIFESELNQLLQKLGFIKNGYEIFSHETKISSGRLDFQYGNTIIEYKKYNLLANKNKIDEYKNQIKNYLNDSKFYGIKMYGFLFDGVYLYSYTKEDNNTIIENTLYNGILTNNNLDFFIKTIFNSGIITISPTNFKRDFGIIDASNNNLLNEDVIALSKYFFYKLKNKKSLHPRTILLFREWEKLFRLSENDNGQHQDIIERRNIFNNIFGEQIDKNSEYEALFSLHTTLSIIIKLILVKMINDMPINSNKLDLVNIYKTNNINEIIDFLAKFEIGNFFNRIGIVNLTDNDFFTWYIKESCDVNFKNNIQFIIAKICKYENIFITNNDIMIDMFKELYINFIPKVVRHSFGEYYTPYWLAEKTLLTALNNEENLEKKTFVDPNCGSGVFLSTFFNYKHKKLKEKIDFEDYLKGIVGIDINPIAILMAKANVLISAFQKCSFELNKKYELPIYLADSLYVPNLISINGIDCFEYELYTTSLQHVLNTNKLKITIPKEIVLKQNFMEIINNVEKEIINKNKKKALSVFENAYESIKNNKDLKKIINDNIETLIKLEDSKLNSIWLKIFSNYFKVACYDKFDYIVGNPAWVQWSVLPEGYRNNIKNNMRMEGLFSEDKNVGGNNLNICALIANKCCERWLSDDGSFCFLMPRSILFNKSFEGFRNLIINKKEQLYFNEIEDYSYKNTGEIFEGVGLDFCAYKISRRKQDNNIIPVKVYKKNKSQLFNNNDNWDNLKNNFSVENKFALPLKTKIHNNFLIVNNEHESKELLPLIGECEYQFRKGVTIPYQMIVEYKENKDDKIGIFHPYKKYGNKIIVDNNTCIELEFDFIKPFIKSPMLKENLLDWSNLYAICPYEEGENKPMSNSKLKNKAPLIYNYLENICEELGKGSKFNKRVQNFDEYYGIIRMGSYVWRDNFVCIRDNTKLAANYIGKIKTAWGTDITPLFDNHISYISEVNNDNDNRGISIDEADYILKILKDEKVNKIIINSQDSRSISSRLPIKIELYDKKNSKG